MNKQRPGATLNGLTVLFILTLASMLVGCSTTQKVDWNARVGNFTYDQAVTENGPPDKQATLSNGETVAEWITRRSAGRSVSFGTGFYGSGAGVGGGGQTVNPGYSDRWLRLVFDQAGKLASWSRN